MAETVAPVVHGVRRWLIAVGAFAAGAVGAGAALGWALGSAGAWAGGGSTHAAWAAAAIVAAYAGREAGLLRLPIPQLRRQVPQRWREVLPLPATAFLYGAGLGLGFVTYVPVATFAAVVAAVVLADPAGGRRRARRVRRRPRDRPRRRDRRPARLGRGGRPVRARGPVAAGRAAAACASRTRARWRRSRACSLRPRRPPPPSPRCGSTSAPIMSPIRRPGLPASSRGIRSTGGVVQGKLRVNGVVQRPPRQDARRRRHAGRRRHRLGVSRSSTPAASPSCAPSSSRAPSRRSSTTGSSIGGSPPRRRLILYDLGTNQSRVIATVKMRSDLGEPDISGRRVVLLGDREGAEARSGSTGSDLQTTRRVLQTPIWAYSHASINGTPSSYVRQGSSGVAVWRLDLASGQDSARLPDRRTARATRCGRRPRRRRPPTSRSTRSRSRSSGMLEAWQPRLRRRVSCAPHSSRRRSGARPISTASATCPCSPRSSRATSRRRCPSTRPRRASRWPTSWPTSTAS